MDEQSTETVALFDSVNIGQLLGKVQLNRWTILFIFVSPVARVAMHVGPRKNISSAICWVFSLYNVQLYNASWVAKFMVVMFLTHQDFLQQLIFFKDIVDNTLKLYFKITEVSLS